MQSTYNQLTELVEHHLAVIYNDIELAQSYQEIASQLLDTMGFKEDVHMTPPLRHHNNWTQEDAVLITYGDSIESPGEKPLSTLHTFLTNCCAKNINSVHILPFFPYSSDDGFSVIDYSSVNESLGDWEDIKRIASDFRLMSDVVINHCSSRIISSRVKALAVTSSSPLVQMKTCRMSSALASLRYFEKRKRPKVLNTFGVHLVTIKLILIFVILKCCKPLSLLFASILITGYVFSDWTP